MRRRPTEKALDSSGQDQLLQSRLAHHLRCLAEDATDRELPSLERLALVRERVARIRETRRDPERSA
jgi:hypothetical protein